MWVNMCSGVLVCFRSCRRVAGEADWHQHQHGCRTAQTGSWWASIHPTKQLMEFFLRFLTVSVFVSLPACNVLYINSVDTESLTGPQAISRAVKCTLTQEPCSSGTVVHFKVSTQGITLTDNQRRYTTHTAKPWELLVNIQQSIIYISTHAS